MASKPKASCVTRAGQRRQLAAEWAALPEEERQAIRGKWTICRLALWSATWCLIARR